MRVMTDDEIIAVVNARKNGRTIECRHQGLSDWWVPTPDSDGATWNFASFEYRVKPEPREFWIHQGGAAGTALHPQILDYKPANPGFIHVREALPE